MVDDALNLSPCGNNAVITKAYIVSKILESNKLSLNEGKCQHIGLHVGDRESTFCPQLKTHDTVMVKSEEDKYLGDIVTADLSNTKNIKARCDRGIGIISNIMIILKEVCLGQFYFKVAVILRESLLFSSMLLNSECWINITKTEI